MINIGERYTLRLFCAYCKAENTGIWYAPSSDSTTFECESCGKKNGIIQEFKAVKLKD